MKCLLKLPINNNANQLLHIDLVNWPSLEFKCPKVKWMKQGKNLFIHITSSWQLNLEKRQEGTFQLVKVMIQSFHVFSLIRKFPTFGSRKLGFPKVFFSSNVNVFNSFLVYFFQVIPPQPQFCLSFYYIFLSHSSSFMTPSFFTSSFYLYHCHFFLSSSFKNFKCGLPQLECPKGVEARNITWHPKVA